MNDGIRRGCIGMTCPQREWGVIESESYVDVFHFTILGIPSSDISFTREFLLFLAPTEIKEVHLEKFQLWTATIINTVDGVKRIKLSMMRINLSNVTDFDNIFCAFDTCII